MELLHKDTPAGRRWYREPVIMGLLLGPAIVVIASFMTLAMAMKSDDGVVVDDYYKQGLAINQILDRDRAAQNLHYQARLVVPATHTRVELRLLGPKPQPEVLSLRLMHPTRSGMDQTVALHLTPDGSYVGSLEPLPAAHWEMKLEDSGRHWRLTGTWVSNKETTVTLGAAAGKSAGMEHLPE